MVVPHAAVGGSWWGRKEEGIDLAGRGRSREAAARHASIMGRRARNEAAAKAAAGRGQPKAAAALLHTAGSGGGRNGRGNEIKE